MIVFCFFADFLNQEIQRRYPSHDGNYRDYLRTFDASYGSYDYVEENIDDTDIDDTDDNID